MLCELMVDKQAKFNIFAIMESFSVCQVLLLVIVASTLTMAQFELRGQYTCRLNPDNRMIMELTAYDLFGIAEGFYAIDENENRIDSCSIIPVGSTTTYRVTVEVNMNTGLEDNSNRCGLNITTFASLPGIVYKWRFRGHSSSNGHILNVYCPLDELSHGIVETQVDVGVNSFTVSADNPAQVTGINAVATNANLIYEVTVVPDRSDTDQALKNALGVYVYNCYSATNENMIVNRQMFIGPNGCRVEGARYAPTSSFGDIIIDTDTSRRIITLRAQYAVASVIDNKKEIFFTCQLGKCPNSGFNQHCDDKCSAHTLGVPEGGAVDTGVTIRSSITVQDRESEDMEALNSANEVIDYIKIGEYFKLVGYFTPNGIGAISAVRDATGYYVYNCRYATNANFVNAITFIGNDGCSSSPNVNSVLTATSGFRNFYDSTINNFRTYELLTDQITVSGNGNQRIWIRCDTGVCRGVNSHTACSQSRCGAVMDGNTQDLGYLGTEVKLSILDPGTISAIDIGIGINGVPIGPNNPLVIGGGVDLNPTITPGGTGQNGNMIPENAKGVYVHSCFMVLPDGSSDYFIDTNGCQDADSPYRPSKRCQSLGNGVPPFSVDCGAITIPGVGNYQYNCSFGYCLTHPNEACTDRCAAGDLAGLQDVVQPQGLSSTSPQFQSSLPTVITDDRTATKSDQLRNTIAAVAVVAAVVLLLVVAIGTCLIVKSQKNSARTYSDDRSYNY